MKFDYHQKKFIFNVLEQCDELDLDFFSSDSSLKKTTIFFKKYSLENYLDKYEKYGNFSSLSENQDIKYNKKRQKVHVLNTLKASRDIFIQFSKKGINYTVLKGVALFFHSIQDPTLKKMRDIDVLIDEKDISESLKILSRLNFKSKHGNLEKLEWMGSLRYHLPIISNDDGVCIDIHTRISEKVDKKNGCRMAKTFLEDSKTMHLRGTEISMLSFEDLILHILFHSTQKHGFDNGPLFLIDILKIMQSKEVDQNKLFDKAKTYNIEKELHLSLTVLKKYFNFTNTKTNGFTFDSLVEDFEDIIFFNNAEKRIHQFFENGILKTFFDAFSPKKISSEFNLPITFINYPYFLLIRLIRQIGLAMPSLFKVLFLKNYYNDHLRLINFKERLKNAKFN